MISAFFIGRDLLTVDFYAGVFALILSIYELCGDRVYIE